MSVNLLSAKRLVGHTPGIPYANVFNRLDDPLDILFALGDGQSSVALARDPSLSHPHVFLGGNDQAAFRAGRPLQGYLGWMFSLGRPEWAEEGVAAATLLGCAVAVGGCAELLRRRRLNPWLALIILELPGSLAAIRQFGPELIGLGLAFFAIACLEDDKVGLAILLFTLAGLARETYLLIPLVYMFFRRDWRLLWPVAAWLSWSVVPWIRFGAWGPNASPNGSRLITLPFIGLARAFGEMRFAPLSLLLIAAVPLLVLVCLRKAPADPLTHVVVVYSAFSIFMGQAVWNWWASFSRPLLPLTACALIVLAASMARAQTAAQPKEIVIDLTEAPVP